MAIYEVKSPLPQTDLTNKRVFLRADLNIPLRNGAILSDLRLQALLPTLNLILQKGGKIILATHIGRPKDYETTLSTHVLIPWFIKHGYHIDFESDLNNAYTKSFHDPKTILLLENLRFYPGEKVLNASFAQSLARLGDYYVNDAFGSLYRTDCSIWEVPQLFTPEKRMIGLLIEQELAHANRLLKADHPFTFIIGGNKLKDKISLIEHLLPKIDVLLLCPPFVFSFLKAQGESVGASLVDANIFDQCTALLRKAHAQNINVMLPLDYMVSKHLFNGPYINKSCDEFNQNDYGISIGIQTQKIFGDIIKQSKTIFYNGLMGDLIQPATLDGARAIFNAMVESKGYSVVGGGDSTAAAQILGFQNALSYLSTGGGSLIAYLSDQELPALRILISK